MTNNEFIIMLLDKKQDLIKICNYHGIFKQTEDILQELYVKLLHFKPINRYVKNGEPNMYIIFKIIRNIIHDYRKVEKRYTDEIIIYFDENNDKRDITQYLEFLKNKHGYSPIEDPEEENEKYDFIVNELESIDNWFNKNCHR